jgi:hypothetical protein
MQWRLAENGHSELTVPLGTYASGIRGIDGVRWTAVTDILRPNAPAPTAKRKRKN